MVCDHCVGKARDQNVTETSGVMFSFRSSRQLSQPTQFLKTKCSLKRSLKLIKLSFSTLKQKPETFEKNDLENTQRATRNPFKETCAFVNACLFVFIL